MRSPVLLITFNRPEATARVIEALRRVRPSRLYFASDAPRAARPGEAAKVKAVRNLVSTIDWPCEIETLFHGQNMGCKMGVAGAINWLFEHESEGIILEDDCLPQASFFPYCDELLERFRNDERIAQICGSAFVPSPVPATDYWFSKYADIWGWATWRRAWRQVDLEMSSWPQWRDAGGLSRLPGATPGFVDYWADVFDVTHDGRLDTWDYQWMLTCWQTGMMSVVPAISQIANIGFDEDATHTSAYNLINPTVQAKARPLEFPLRHNNHVKAYEGAERAIAQNRYSLGLISEAAALMRRIPVAGPVLVAMVKMARTKVADYL